MKTKAWSGVELNDTIMYDEGLIVPTHDLGSWVGVEIEFISPTCTEDFNMLLEDEGCHHVDVKDDGSIYSNSIENGDAYPTEFAVLTHIKDMSNLKTALRVANVDGYVNASCGLHVHLDMRHLNKKQAYRVAKRLKRALPLLRSIVAPYRLNTKYCKKDIAGRDDRYAAINFHEAYFKYKTIEIRLHQGTLDYSKIRNWILLLYKISRAEVLDYKVNKNAIRNVLSLPSTLNRYVDNRLTTINLIKTLEPSEVLRYTEVDLWA